MSSLIGKQLLRLNHLPLWRIQMRVWGNRLRATSADRALYLLLNKFSIMGRSELRLFEGLLQPGMTAVDVGANLGCYSLKFADSVGPAGRVFSFEPNPILARALQQNVRQNQAENIQIYPIALGAEAGHTQLLVGTFNSGDNYLADAAGPRGHARQGVTVKVDTFDALFHNEDVDFVKIDVQGGEMGVLKGMQETISRLPNLMIFIEVCGAGIAASGGSPTTFLSWLTDRGLSLYREEGKQWRALADPQSFADYCARHPKYYTNVLAARPGNPRIREVIS